MRQAGSIAAAKPQSCTHKQLMDGNTQRWRSREREAWSKAYLRKALGAEQGHGWEGGYGGGCLEARSLVLVAQVLHDNRMQPAVHDPVSRPGARTRELLLRLWRAGDAFLDT